MKADLELVVDQVFGLCKVADKLFPFLLSQPSEPGPLHDLGRLEYLFLVLKFDLPVDQFLAEYFFFTIQVNEHLQVLLLLVGLFFLYYAFNFSVLLHAFFQLELLLYRSLNTGLV